MPDQSNSAPPTPKPASAPETRGVRDPMVLDAMQSVPREAFPTAAGIPPPDAIGRVLEALELRPGDRVLKVGTGSGWTASVLGRLAAEVWAVERDSAAADLARECIDKLGIGNVRVITGEMTCDEVGRHAPYDAILVSSPVESIPDGLMGRLRPGGRLVAIVDGKTARRRLRRIRVQEDGSRLTDDLGESRGTPLLGDVLVAAGRVPRATV